MARINETSASLSSENLLSYCPRMEIGGPAIILSHSGLGVELKGWQDLSVFCPTMENFRRHTHSYQCYFGGSRSLLVVGICMGIFLALFVVDPNADDPQGWRSTQFSGHIHTT
jgi:hypothetical protein